MPRVDRVDEVLRARGVADFVIAGGLAGLVGSWERFADEVERGYAGDIHEWLNDVDGRDILDAALAVASEDQRRAWRRRVRLADERVRACSTPAGRCLWGAKNAAKSGWSAGHQWWYYIHPKHMNAQFASDLASQ